MRTPSWTTRLPCPIGMMDWVRACVGEVERPTSATETMNGSAAAAWRCYSASFQSIDALASVSVAQESRFCFMRFPARRASSTQSSNMHGPRACPCINGVGRAARWTADDCITQNRDLYQTLRSVEGPGSPGLQHVAHVARETCLSDRTGHRARSTPHCTHAARSTILTAYSCTAATS